MNKRYEFVDNVKGIAIISVVLGHLFAMVSSSDPMVELDRPVRFLSVYELAVFFVVSGFLMAQKEPEGLDFKHYTVKRFKRLMPVYLVFSLLYLFQEISLTNTLHIVTGFGISVLWFLPTLLLGEALWLLVRRLGRTWLQAAVSASLAAAACVCGSFMRAGEREAGALWLQAVGCVFVLALRACVGQLFVGVGYALDGFLKKAGGRRTALVTALCLAAGISCGLAVSTADWRIMNIEEPLLWLTGAAALSAGLVLIFYSLEKRRLRVPALGQIGRESLLIMCTHLQFGIMPLCISLGYQASAASPHAKSYILWGTILLSLAAVETVLVLIKRHGYKY